MVLPGLLLWFTLLPNGFEQPLVQTVLGRLSVAIRTWKIGLRLRPRIFQSFGV